MKKVHSAGYELPFEFRHRRNLKFSIISETYFMKANRNTEVVRQNCAGSKVRVHSQHMTFAARAQANKQTFRAPIMLGCDAPPVLEAGKAVLDLVALAVARFVVQHRSLATFSRRDAGPDCFNYMGFTIPIGIIAPI